MRVVDHHQRLVAATETLHAARWPLQLRQDLENLVEAVVQPLQRADHRQQVAQVETTEQIAAQHAFAARCHQARTHAVIVEVRFAAIKEGAGIAEAIADQA